VLGRGARARGARQVSDELPCRGQVMLVAVPDGGQIGAEQARGQAEN